MKKKLLTVFVFLFSLVTLVALAACGGKSLKFTPEKPEYDVGTGGDLTLTVNLDGEKITRIKDGDSVVDSTEWLVEGNKLTIFESYMLYIELGDHVFHVTSEKREGAFTVSVGNKIVTSFDTTDKNYTYGSTESMAIDADLSSTSITSVKAGARKLTANDYSYSSSAHKFTINNTYLQTLYGTTEFTVALSNNTEYKFKVISDCMFAANFDDEYVPVFFNDNPGVTTDGWNGTKALHWAGNGGNLMLFYAGTFSWGMKQDFDPEKIYELSFKFKNNWSDETKSPAGFLNMNVNNQLVFASNYLTGQCDGGVAQIDENGVWSVKIYFKGCETNGFSAMYSGYDPARPNDNLFDLLFDDIVLNEAKAENIVMSDTEKSAPRGGNTSDIWFDGTFGLHTVKSVKVGGSEINANNYTVYASSIAFKAAYVNSLTQDTVCTVTFDNDETVQLTIKMGKSLPTSFDQEGQRYYEIGKGGDLSYAINLRDFSILNIMRGDKLVPESAYEVTNGRLILKQAYLNTLYGENHFVLTVDNAGQVEGKDEAEVHRFAVITNAIANFYFDDETAGTQLSASPIYGALSGALAATKSEIVEDGISGKSWDLEATGGNFMAIKGTNGTWQHGAYVVTALEEGSIYNLSFDIKLISEEKRGGEAEHIVFVLHTTTNGKQYSLTFNDEKELSATGADGIEITAKGNGVYNVSTRLTYSATTHNGCIRLEALYYQQIYFEILLDNIVITKVPLALSALYEYNSNEDVSYNVAFESVKSVTVDGEELPSEYYTVADGKFTVKGAYAQTIIDSVELVVTLEDDSEETFVLESTMMHAVDFEGTYDTAMNGYGNASVVEGFDGKSWKVAGTGGNFMTFAAETANWIAVSKHPAHKTNFKDNATYTISFDFKVNSITKHGSQEASDREFRLVFHGTSGDSKLLFATGSTTPVIDPQASNNITLTEKGDGVYTVTYEFTYRTEGGNMGCVGLEADGYNAVDYDILFDNIVLMRKA